MKETGMVRRIDDLGRIVLPREIRKTLRLHEGDQLGIFVSPEGILLQKHHTLQTLNELVNDYAQILFGVTNIPVIITDSDKVIASFGLTAKIVDKKISEDLHHTIINGLPLSEKGTLIVDDLKYMAGCVEIIKSASDSEIAGSVIFTESSFGDLIGKDKIKYAEMIANLIGKNL